jgi:hypothetical protein
MTTSDDVSQSSDSIAYHNAVSLILTMHTSTAPRYQRHSVCSGPVVQRSRLWLVTRRVNQTDVLMLTINVIPRADIGQHCWGGVTDVSLLLIGPAGQREDGGVALRHETRLPRVQAGCSDLSNWAGDHSLRRSKYSGSEIRAEHLFESRGVLHESRGARDLTTRSICTLCNQIRNQIRASKRTFMDL